MNYLENLKTEVLSLAKILDAPESLIPTFVSSQQDGLPHIETTGKEYHFVICERGQEFSRQRTFEKTEILFWVFDSITSTMASNLELANIRENEDSRIQLFEIQEKLISKINPQYADILNRKHQQLLNN